MPSTDLLIAFFTAAAIFAFIPGPGNPHTAAQTMAGGRSAGLLGTLGFALAATCMSSPPPLGLSIVFHAVPPL